MLDFGENNDKFQRRKMVPSTKNHATDEIETTHAHWRGYSR